MPTNQAHHGLRMSILTIFCCGTGSNSFDASRWGRNRDEWDALAPGESSKSRFDVLMEKKSEPLVAAQLKRIMALRKSAMTPYSHGKYFQGEIVSTLATQHRGKEFVDWIQIDGPGSGNQQDPMLWTRPGQHGALIGQVLGAGLTENVRHAVAVIKNKVEEGGRHGVGKSALIRDHGKKLPARGALAAITPQKLQSQIARMGRGMSSQGSRKIAQVNLVGWSRGAATCIAIANAMARDPECAGIKANILAVDPVPGAFAEKIFGRETQLPACVDEYFGIYARDEVSVGFAPVIPKYEAASTTVRLLPLPGMHASVAGSSRVDKQGKVEPAFDIQQPARLARYWAENRLAKWGADIRRTANYSAIDLFLLYEEMLAGNPEFLKMQGYSYTLLKQGIIDTYRKFYAAGAGRISNYLSIDTLARDPRFRDMKMMLREQGRLFVNWHHKLLYDKLGIGALATCMTGFDNSATSSLTRVA